MIDRFVEQHREDLDARELAVIHTEVNKGSAISWLSPDLEPAMFVWFALGKNTREISQLTMIPEAVILLTMLKYNWKAKLATYHSSGETGINAVARDTASQILALTTLAVQRDILDVMKEGKDPRSSDYVPKNTTQLKALLDILNKEEPKEAVQVNVNVTKPEETVAEKPKISKLEMLKALAEE